MFRYIFLLFGILSFSCATTGSQSSLGSAASLLAFVEPIPSIAPHAATYYKKGEACSYNLFGLLGFGNSSIYKAAEKGKITKLGIVDQAMIKYSIAYIYYFGIVCTKVSGE
ncbi:TRL domain-containing protein [Leptospira sp. 'Mane']|uniref:TRL domain-containing protein n=1 Tax=Leptospira sp. 'Mane' TaxID=3387407 RepID=UPI00398AC301